ncbi:MAG: hypothetical protein N2Z58_01860, partial [Fervidobacterium sp.]|nr:hypothetical protein [Fervidobacterium sp.]
QIIPFNYLGDGKILIGNTNNKSISSSKCLDELNSLLREVTVNALLNNKESGLYQYCINK